MPKATTSVEHPANVDGDVALASDPEPAHGLAYRPEIDGLRGIAVLIVVLFHLQLGCPGGYVGVDVFFVISGFLITSLLWEELQGGTISFVDFWARRARRIVPALFFVVVTTLIACWFLLLPQDLTAVSNVAATQSVFAANIYVWWNRGYFIQDELQKPLGHTWSLGVEEQFYLIIPLLLWGIATWRPRATKTTISILLMLFLISFVASIRMVAWNSVDAYFLMPPRAWELLIGAILALLMAGKPSATSGGILQQSMLAVGLLLIAWPCCYFKSNTPFPGLNALWPCLGAAFVIVGSSPSTDAAGILNRGLRWRPLVGIGRISYSLYLWHFPALALVRYYQMPAPLRLRHRLAILLVSFVLSVFTWRFVENPFRRSTAPNRRVLLVSMTALLTLPVVCFLCHLNAGFPSRFDKEIVELDQGEQKMPFHYDLTAADIDSDQLIRVGARSETAALKLLVWGDSHAMAMMPAVDQLLREQGLRGYFAGHSGTAPVLDWSRADFQPGGLRGQDAIRFSDSVLRFIEREEIEHVLLVASWRTYTYFDPYWFSKAFSDTVKRLSEHGVKPWILLDVPTQWFSTPKALARTRINGMSLEPYCAQPSEYFTTDPSHPYLLNDDYDQLTSELIDELRSLGAVVLDPKPEFVDSENRCYRVTLDDVILYRDEHHLTANGARAVILPFLRRELKLSADQQPTLQQEIESR